MEPQTIVRVVYGVIILGLIGWFSWEGWKMYKLHMHYKKRREAYARLTEEVEAIEKRAEEEAAKNGNV
jgi:predicted negative regulator of RcsB-dependent stress response